MAAAEEREEMEEREEVEEAGPGYRARNAGMQHSPTCTMAACCRTLPTLHSSNGCISGKGYQEGI